jgi:hypothetical protein
VQIVSSLIADFTIDGFDFEIGGKNKSNKQFKTATKGFVVKDDIKLVLLTRFLYGILGYYIDFFGQ